MKQLILPSSKGILESVLFFLIAQVKRFFYYHFGNFRYL